MKTRFLALLLPFCLCLTAVVAAAQEQQQQQQQSQDSSVRKTIGFDSGGLRFKYPADWTLTDKSTDETQHLLLSKKDRPLLIVILSPRTPQEYFGKIHKFQNDIHANFGSGISKSLSTPAKPADDELVCMDFNGANIPGTRYTGSYKDEPGQGETYTFILGGRSLTVVYMKTDSESMQGDWVWQEVLKSLSLDGSTEALPGVIYNAKEGGVVNGKAVKLVKPNYPLALRTGEMPRLGGTFEVKVVIDEQGKVIAAMPHSGPTAFMRESVKAAQKSLFKPTLVCGKPIKVVGIIAYNYIGR
ncbi:MAG: energy transducer TonB [Acidobacteriota bacterium]|nr:energy transducer TonB [Acidobacteriota bacterium]